jgi:hypothetical protein
MCSGHACGEYIYQGAQPFCSAYDDLNFLLFNSYKTVKTQKANHFQDLERRADALKMECTSLSAQVQSGQVCSIVVS